MNWHIIAAIAVAGIASTFTDWLFMGVLFRDRYMKYPDTWWPGVAEGKETRAIIMSSVLDFVTAAAVVVLCIVAGVHNIKGGLIVAALAAAAGPLVTTITNGFWIRIDPAITGAHTVGYIVRFLLAGVAYALIAA
jgi:hypothetical protein